MSVRIYQLSKEIDMDNSELITLLRERGYEVKSASSTVDNISAESIREEFKNQGASNKAKPASEEASPDASPAVVAPPSGAIVRSREEIEQERREREEELLAAKKAAAAVQPAVKAPPVVPPMGKTPPPIGKMPVRQGPPSVVPPRPPAPAGKAAPAVPTINIPAQVVAPKKAPEVPPMGNAPKPAPQAPRPPAGSPAPVLRPPVLRGPGGPKSVVPPRQPAPAAPEASEVDGAEAAEAAPEGKVISIKPPIVVRDFAVLIGKKPFQLISELMEMNIFASMNQVIEEDVAKRIAGKHGFSLEVKHRDEKCFYQQLPGSIAGRDA